MRIADVQYAFLCQGCVRGLGSTPHTWKYAQCTSCKRMKLCVEYRLVSKGGVLEVEEM